IQNSGICRGRENKGFKTGADYSIRRSRKLKMPGGRKVIGLRFLRKTGIISIFGLLISKTDFETIPVRVPIHAIKLINCNVITGSDKAVPLFIAGKWGNEVELRKNFFSLNEPAFTFSLVV